MECNGKLSKERPVYGGTGCFGRNLGSRLGELSAFVTEPVYTLQEIRAHKGLEVHDHFTT